ncbi:hypothetical protein GGX14DRAFT_553524 [Mycena pura]|uniref:Uncharacterized protein n=1 Tax=Mycena pura TaxID=153505 RepID=A0AAD6YUT4_9AGAR|nr:hypothetical protein GGX14DRAFT_553524 [Mycena pura]
MSIYQRQPTAVFSSLLKLLSSYGCGLQHVPHAHNSGTMIVASALALRAHPCRLAPGVGLLDVLTPSFPLAQPWRIPPSSIRIA